VFNKDEQQAKKHLVVRSNFFSTRSRRIVMKKLMVIFLSVSLLLIILLLAGCTSPATTEPAAPVVTYVVQNGDGITAEIVWDGTGWSCNLPSCAQNRQVDGNTFHFFYGSSEIAVEDVENPGKLVLKDGWKIIEEVSN